MNKSKERVSIMSVFQNTEADLYFSKSSALSKINALPNNWELNETGDVLTSQVDKDQQIKVSDLHGYKIGETVLFEPVKKVVSEIKLVRFGDITEEMAVRTGVEKVCAKRWRHYAPELFFPKNVLKNQKPGFPRYNTALGSFGSLWCKQNDIMDIYINPWIWQYTCIIIK